MVLGLLVRQLFNPTYGVMPWLFGLFGAEPVYLLTHAPTFRLLLIVTGIWQGVGWGSIIYLAALSSIDAGLYENAAMDGANRLQQAVHVTIPGLVPVMVILFILSLGRLLEVGFDQIFNLYNEVVYEKADIIDTYVYRRGILGTQYGYTAAVGLFKNVAGIVLLIGSNLVIRRFSEYGIW